MVSISGRTKEARNRRKKDFGQRLRAAMLKCKFTQSDLARRAGINRDAVSHYVRGRSLPRDGALDSLARALNTSVEALLPAEEAEVRNFHPIDKDRIRVELNVIVSWDCADKIRAALYHRR